METVTEAERAFSKVASGDWTLSDASPFPTGACSGVWYSVGPVSQENWHPHAIFPRKSSTPPGKLEPPSDCRILGTPSQKS